VENIGCVCARSRYRGRDANNAFDPEDKSFCSIHYVRLQVTPLQSTTRNYLVNSMFSFRQAWSDSYLRSVVTQQIFTSVMPCALAVCTRGYHFKGSVYLLLCYPKQVDFSIVPG
jgi:hypothetical protein